MGRVSRIDLQVRGHIYIQGTQELHVVFVIDGNNMGQMMPKQPATAAGFALGLAIIIGGIPIMGGLSYITGNPAMCLWWRMKAIKKSSR